MVVQAIGTFAIDYKYLAIATVRADLDTVVLLVALEWIAPRTSGVGVIVELKDVEVTAIRLTSTENDIAVGKFLNLRLVASTASLNRIGRQKIPRLAKVVGINDIGTGNVVATTQ